MMPRRTGLASARNNSAAPSTSALTSEAYRHSHVCTCQGDTDVGECSLGEVEHRCGSFVGAPLVDHNCPGPRRRAAAADRHQPTRATSDLTPRTAAPPSQVVPRSWRLRTARPSMAALSLTNPSPVGVLAAAHLGSQRSTQLLVYRALRRVLAAAVCSRVWTPAVAAAGLAPLRIHDLRHTTASLAIAAGADVKMLQTMLGHASAVMTLDRYGHLMPGRAQGRRRPPRCPRQGSVGRDGLARVPA